MKEELQGKLVEILTSIQTAAGKASDFALAELPDIAQSYIVYGRAATTLAVVASTLVLLLVGVVAWRLNAKATSRKYYDPFPYIMGAMVAAVGPVVGFATNIGPCLMVWFAPKVWLLKEIAGLLK